MEDSERKEEVGGARTLTSSSPLCQTPGGMLSSLLNFHLPNGSSFPLPFSLCKGHHLGDGRDKGGRDQKTNKPERQGRSQKQEAREKGLGLLRKKTYEGGGHNIATSNRHRIRRLKEEIQSDCDGFGHSSTQCPSPGTNLAH